MARPRFVVHTASKQRTTSPLCRHKDQSHCRHAAFIAWNMIRIFLVMMQNALSVKASRIGRAWKTALQAELTRTLLHRLQTKRNVRIEVDA